MIADYLYQEPVGQVLASPSDVDLDARLVEVWTPGDARPTVVHDVLA